MDKEVIGEYFVDYDENSSSWCVFHTDIKTGFAYGSYSTKEEAEKNVAERNNRR
jgi:hypothetical protein